MEFEQMEKAFLEAAAYYREQKKPKDQELLTEFLRECQEIYGCIPREAKERIAEIMEVKMTVIDTLIRLYPSLKEQDYQEEIVICQASSCLGNGSGELLKLAEKHLGIKAGEVTADGRYRLRTRKCFKKCGLGPNVQVGERLYHHVDKEKFLKIIDRIKD